MDINTSKEKSSDEIFDINFVDTNIENNVDKLLVVLIEDVVKNKNLSNVIIKKLIDSNFIKNKKILKNNKKKQIEVFRQNFFELIALFKKTIDKDNSPKSGEDVYELTVLNNNIDKQNLSCFSYSMNSRPEVISLEKLGSGSFSEVFKIYHKIDRNIYALKKIYIDPKKVTNKELDNISNEVKILSKFNHENIIRYYTSWVEYKNEKLYLNIQTEFCDYTLTSFLENRNDLEDFDININNNIIRQILNGVNYIHKNNLIHLDLKPDNIFLVNPFKLEYDKILIDKVFNFIVKIGDFGISTSSINTLSRNNSLTLLNKHYQDISLNSESSDFQQDNNECFGTELYTNPISSSPSEKSDIYSLAIVFFEIYYPLKTKMDKINIINDLKNNNNFPQDFDNPIIKELILNMLNNKDITINYILDKYFV